MTQAPLPPAPSPAAPPNPLAGLLAGLAPGMARAAAGGAATAVLTRLQVVVGGLAGVAVAALDVAVWHRLGIAFDSGLIVASLGAVIGHGFAVKA